MGNSKCEACRRREYSNVRLRTQGLEERVETVGGNGGSRGLEESSGYEEDLRLGRQRRPPDSFQRWGEQMPSNRTGSLQIKTRVGPARTDSPRVRQRRLEG